MSDVENNKDKLKDSQYDGIQEYDNDLPKWWVATFVATIVFAFLYWSYKYTFDGPSNVDQYEQAYQTHQEKYFEKDKGEVTNDTILALLDSEMALSSGKEIFDQNCAVCHANNGGGGIGPNLTDEYWIHGAQPTDIYYTVEKGVVEKGMLAWKGILTVDQMQQVSAYVTTMKNTNVAGGKEPQGEMVSAE